MLASSEAVLKEMAEIADRMSSGGSPGDLKKLKRLATRHKSRIAPHRTKLKAVSRHAVDRRTVESAHADLVKHAHNLCADLAAWTGRTDSKLAAARMRDYIAKVRTELDHEASLVGPTKQGGRPRSKEKTKAVREYLKARASGMSRKEAVIHANQKVGTRYRLETLIRYSKRK
jgi:hypothetical protein